MKRRTFRGGLFGATAAALGLATTTALAGSGTGGIFNLGLANAVDAQTSLSGNPSANPQLRLVNGGTGAALKAESQTGIGVNGISVSGTGQFGQSQSGIGLQGLHSDATGTNPGVEGKTNSADPNGAGVVGRNTGGGPGLKAIVTAGTPPLSVNSQVKVTNLNADFLDGLDSGALQKRISSGCASGQAVRVVNADGTASCEPVNMGGAWGLNGNGGTTAGSFLGTTDAKPLVLKTNNTEALRLTENGNVGVGTQTPGAKLDVNAGTSTDPFGVGIFGRIDSMGFGALSAAVEGENASTSNIGMGVAGIHHGSGWGVYGESVSGTGVFGRHSSTAGTDPGVYGETHSDEFGAVGVEGVHSSAENGGAAVAGVNSGAGSGVVGCRAASISDCLSTAEAGGVFVGHPTAAFFFGDVDILGTLSKTAGSFRIDHPLHPATEYLQHSFVESPDMMNVYNGNVTTDARGFATVKLPDWFQALNRDFRYQLTILGTRGWRARVVKEIAGNRFTLQTDVPRAKVSWQVTGIRHDRYANAHRIQVEVRKPPGERGKYLLPGLYGKPSALSIGRAATKGGRR